MSWEWKIGDPVDDATGGSMDAQNWGHGSSDEKESFGPKRSVELKIRRYSKKAWNLYMNYRETEALNYINLALDLNDRNAANWNIKAIILEAMDRYSESEECYDMSLSLSPVNLVYDNRSRMLYSWASKLRDESKDAVNSLNMLIDAHSKVFKAITTLPAKSEENPDKYLKLVESINFYIGYERKYQKNLETLKRFDKGELFTITGMNFYENDIVLTQGLALKLVKERDNEFDSDAIAVYADDKKIGYVANKDYTRFDMTSSAFELKDKFQDSARAEYLIYLEKYEEIQFSIARFLNSS